MNLNNPILAIDFLEAAKEGGTLGGQALLFVAVLTLGYAAINATITP